MSREAPMSKLLDYWQKRALAAESEVALLASLLEKPQNPAPPSLISENLRRDLVETARSAPPGDIVEVGVYQGGSAYQLAEVAREQGRRIFLFDTFTGIPMQGEHDRHPVGDFGDTSLEAVKQAIPDAIFVVGTFPETLEGVDVGPIAFAHIDCDQYESVKACCVHLAPLMTRGGVMVFDDYAMLEGATLAVDEVFGQRVEKSPWHKARVRF